MFDENKRKSPRITYKCSITLWEPGGFATIFTHTVNIGAGGLMVNLDQGLMIGAKVDVKIDFSEDTVFECSGRIQRCRQYTDSEDNSKRFFTIGIVFENLDEQQKITIEKIVSRILNQQNSF